MAVAMTERREIPAGAFKLRATRFELADGKGEAGGPVPVRILARSAEAVEHPYWGRIVHDLDGMWSKPKVPIDWCHDPDEVIGYADAFEKQPDGLYIAGRLIPHGDDRAAEVAFKAAAGVPYEASINFGGGGIKLEEVAAGVSVEVNGREFVGPLVVVREWPLRGVAICPYGADANTAAEFANGGGEIAIDVVPADRGGKSGRVINLASRGPRLFAARSQGAEPAASGGKGDGSGRGGVIRIRK